MIKKLLKGIFKVIPFKKQLFTIIRTTFRLKEPLYKHLYFKGVFKVAIDKQHSFKIMHHGYQVENEIFWEGIEDGWEKHSMRVWMALTKRSNVIFDVGANTGVFSLVSSSLNPAAKVYAFEPVARVYKKLVANKELNNYSISTCDKALSNYDGKAVIFDIEADHTYQASVNKNFQPQPEKAKQVDIEVVTLKTFIETNNISGIDLMKIDVETHEPEVLEGFGPYLERFRPALLIEILDDDIAAKVSKLVAPVNYLYFNIDEHTGIRQTATIGKSDFFNYLFCSREQAEYLKLI